MKDEKDKLIELLFARIEQLESIIKKQDAKIASLEARLAKNSHNSSKPPSSDGFKKGPPKSRSLRKKSGKRSGGQVGHKGSTLEKVSHVDFTIKHKLTHCNKCLKSLQQSPLLNVESRQVFDIPRPSVTVTEHVGEVKVCPRCNHKQTASFPKGVNSPTQYGEHIKSILVYLRQYQLIPEARLQMLMQDLFGVALSKSTISKAQLNTYLNLEGFEKRLLKKVNQLPLVHLDETGLRVQSRMHWLHVAGDAHWTYYHVNIRRKSLLEELTGILVHDHWLPYFTLTDCEHVLCNAHHLRELNALIDVDERWAHQMKRWLLFSLTLKKHYEPGYIPVDKRLRLFKIYDDIIKRGVMFHEAKFNPDIQKKPHGIKRAKGHNLVRRLRDFKQETTLFLMDPSIPFTNNLAEQDIRMMKVQQKISGSFRSLLGAKIFARIRSLISTARKQDWDVFETLRLAVTGQLVFPRARDQPS